MAISKIIYKENAEATPHGNLAFMAGTKFNGSRLLP